MRLLLFASALLATSLMSRASTLTFSGAPHGTTNSPYTEAGYTVSVLSGQVFYNSLGNPGTDLEGQAFTTGGMIAVTATDGSNFDFSGLDYAAYAPSGTGEQTLVVTGIRNGVLIGTQTYTLQNTDMYQPYYSNWTNETSGILTGVPLSKLEIALAADYGSIDIKAVDNIIVNGVPSSVTPEPSSFILLGTGLLCVAGMIDRRLA